jgi:hypothetical protein
MEDKEINSDLIKDILLGKVNDFNPDVLISSRPVNLSTSKGGIKRKVKDDDITIEAKKVEDMVISEQFEINQNTIDNEPEYKDTVTISKIESEKAFEELKNSINPTDLEIKIWKTGNDAKIITSSKDIPDFLKKNG